MSVCECGSLISESYELPTGLICAICLKPKILSLREKQKRRAEDRKRLENIFNKNNYGGILLPRQVATKRRSPREATPQEYKNANHPKRSGFRRQALSEKRLEEISLLEKWNNHYGCRVCGSLEYLTIDHIIPRGKMGQNTMNNKQVLCEYHNTIKSDFLPGKNGWWPDELMEFLNGK